MFQNPQLLTLLWLHLKTFLEVVAVEILQTCLPPFPLAPTFLLPGFDSILTLFASVLEHYTGSSRASPQREEVHCGSHLWDTRALFVSPTHSELNIHYPHGAVWTGKSGGGEEPAWPTESIAYGGQVSEYKGRTFLKEKDIWSLTSPVSKS